jgi:hypothetical protein
MIKNFGMVVPADYVGITLEVATVKAKENGFSSRVVEVDGKSLMITEDLKNNRINFRVKGGVVTDVYPG